MTIATWDELPTKGELKTRIDAFLRAIRDARFEEALAICPLEAFVKGEGMVLRIGLSKGELREQLRSTMFQFIESQRVVRDALESAKAEDPETWCTLITPPSDVDFEDICLDFPFESEDEDEDELEDAPDSTRATGDGEVLANVHLAGEVTDITARYSLGEREGKWFLAFHHFDVM